MKKQILKLIGLAWLFLGFTAEGPKPKPFTYKVQKVVIDAGHGGKDPGCQGGHSKEKHITLGIALKLGRYIERNMDDVEVIYTRTTDRYIELIERANIANRNDADLFISIHCNAQPNGGSAYGTETYVMGLHKSEANLRVAKRENSVILLEDDYRTSYDGFDPSTPESHIIFSLYQNAYLEQSIRYASLCEKYFEDYANRRSRGVKQAGFLVLYKTAMPSVLVESGYLTNNKEESYLLTDEGQAYIASSMFRAFVEYKEEVEERGLDFPIIEDDALSDKKPPVVAQKETPKPTKPKSEPKSQPKKVEKKPTYKETSNTTAKKEVTKKSPSPKSSKKSSPKSSPKKKEVIIVKKDKRKYRIQLYTSYDAFNLSEARFDQLSTVEIESNNRGVKKYLLLDEFSQRNEAEYILQTAKKAGFKFAKIVEYQDEGRVN